MRVSFRNGVLRIHGAVLAKVGVSPYHPDEVHTFHGAQVDRIAILRAAAWVKGAATFRGKPITLDHVEMTDTGHLPPKPEQIVGRAGEVQLRDPYLLGTVSIWGRQALDQIASGELGALSIGYGWQVERRGGVFRGVAFDGRALSITGHHIALVHRSRGGDAVRLRLPPHIRQALKRKARAAERPKAPMRSLIAVRVVTPRGEVL
jgi:hypothetical protein